MSTEFHGNIDKYVNRQCLIRKIQDLRVMARDATNFQELQDLKQRIRNTQMKLERIQSIDRDLSERV